MVMKNEYEKAIEFLKVGCGCGCSSKVGGIWRLLVEGGEYRWECG